jgi:hypothetical protein
MARSSFRLADLLDAPDLEARILAQLARRPDADPQALANALETDEAEVRAVLTSLAERGHIRFLADGRVRLALGWSRRRALPADVWRALLPADRLYSTQDIVTLRTVIPILQFARAKMGEFADHGPAHALRVKSFATQLAFLLGLTKAEQQLLRAAALFHDVGNILDRQRHHIISQETVERLTAVGELPFSPEEAALVGLLCRWHRAREKDFDPERIDTLRNELVRTGVLGSVLRVADAMDIDYRRSDYTESFARVLKFFFPEELPYWTSLEEILGVRVLCTPVVDREPSGAPVDDAGKARADNPGQVSLQVFVRHAADENMQITMLRQDVLSTPLGWSVDTIALDVPARESQAGSAGHQPRLSVAGAAGTALIAFPFDPHSLVMAALSRTHLRAAGYAVSVLCYPDAADGALWLWDEALADLDPANYTHLVVIGDRIDPHERANGLDVIKRWRAAGVKLSLLNRHEASWSRLPRVLRSGVEVTLGDDWAYFWGTPSSAAALAWARIASLCTRDPTQSIVGIPSSEQTMTQGLLAAVYEVAGGSPTDSADWAALAEPIMERIAADDRAWFAERAPAFVATYAPPVSPSRIEGRVLIFEQSPCALSQAAYWPLEAAIERHGRAPVRGIQFAVPYAIAFWPIDSGIVLLAISHWREEHATPIRLLYPIELGPSPQGNESTIRVRLAADQAFAVVDALVAACNQA